jgi:hypothetical protein
MGRAFGHPMLILDIGGLCAIIAMGAMMLWAVIAHTVTLYDQERLG